MDTNNQKQDALELNSLVNPSLTEAPEVEAPEAEAEAHEEEAEAPEAEAVELEAPEAEAHEAEAGEAKSHDFENNSFRFDEEEFNSEDGFDFGTGLDGLSIDATTVLKQTFSFDDADVSMLLDKCIRGDVRLIAQDDATSPFHRNVPVNNYPGPGDLSQGMVEDAVAQSGEDNIPAPVPGYLQVLSPDGIPFPNSRQLSNTLADQGDSFTPEEAGFNNLFMGTGQYIDHGLDLIPKTDDESVGGEMTVYLPDNDPLNGKSFDFKGQPVNKLNLLPRALPDEGTAKPLEAEYTNSKTPFADQDQTYGGTKQIAEYLRANDMYGNDTAYVLDNKFSKQSNLDVFSQYGPKQDNALPTIFDVIVNRAHALGHESQEALMDDIEYVLGKSPNAEKWQKADQVLRLWDEKVRAQDFSRSITGNPRMDAVELDGETHSVMDAIVSLGEAQGGTSWRS